MNKSNMIYQPTRPGRRLASGWTANVILTPPFASAAARVGAALRIPSLPKFSSINLRSHTGAQRAIALPNIESVCQGKPLLTD